MLLLGTPFPARPPPRRASDTPPPPADPRSTPASASSAPLPPLIDPFDAFASAAPTGPAATPSPTAASDPGDELAAALGNADYFGFSVAIVEYNHVGVLHDTITHHISEQVWGEGRHFVGLGRVFYQYPQRTRLLDFSWLDGATSYGGDATSIYDADGLAGFTADGQHVTAAVTVFYRLRRDEVEQAVSEHKGESTDGDEKAEDAVAGASGTHVVLPGYYCPRDQGLLDYNTSDGRFLFFLPWLGHTLVGTTDAPSAAETRPTAPEDEVQWLLNECSRYLSPDVRVSRKDVLSAWRGWSRRGVPPRAAPRERARRYVATASVAQATPRARSARGTRRACVARPCHLAGPFHERRLRRGRQVDHVARDG